MTLTVQSADGSSIAYEKSGTGPALIVIGGAFSTRQGALDIAPLLATHFSVYAYDRRGRGDSTEAGPFTVEREVEDLAALIDAVGGSACVYGHSSGAVLALEAAASGLPIVKLALYEPPFSAQEGGPGATDSWGEGVKAAVAAGDREDAAMRFMAGTGADSATVAGMKEMPWWPGMLAVAHTLPYDLALLGDGSVPAERYRRIDIPTLLLYGADSPPWAGDAVATLTDALADAKSVAIQGQGHGADPAVLAPEITDFFRSASEETGEPGEPGEPGMTGEPA